MKGSISSKEVQFLLKSKPTTTNSIKICGYCYLPQRLQTNYVCAEVGDEEIKLKWLYDSEMFRQLRCLKGKMAVSNALKLTNDIPVTTAICLKEVNHG